jgi:hypothetical protein
MDKQRDFHDYGSINKENQRDKQWDLRDSSNNMDNHSDFHDSPGT